MVPDCMLESSLAYVHLVFVSFVALIPPVNPLGTAIIVEPLLSSLGKADRKTAAKKIAVYCMMICAGATMVGSWIFRLFGISLPVVQMAGGVLICRMAWNLLSQKNESEKDSSPKSVAHVENILFYPLAFPITTGAGTISVLLTLSAHSHTGDWEHYLTNLSAILVSVVAMCVVIYWSYAFTPRLIAKLGVRGEQIVNQLSAFMVFCVGIQIASTGILQLFRS